MNRPQTVKRLVPLTVAAMLVGVARADYNPVPLTPGSFNADVVVEKTAPPSMSGCTTATFDGGTNNNGYTFYEQGYANFPLAGTAKTTGVPTAGSTFAAASDPNHTFQMPPDYKKNNALLLGNYAGYTNGTLTLTTPAAYTKLSVLGTAANGPENNTVTIHYAGGGTQTTTLAINDWFGSTPVAWYANGRVSVDSGNLDYNNFYQLSDGNPRLLYFDINLTDTTDNVTSIDFAYTSGGRAGVFALSGSTDGTTFTPVAVTGFDKDMIVEATGPKSDFTPTVSVTLDGGPGVTGWMFYENGFHGYTDGLPHPGANVVFGNHTWSMASNYAANNCVFLGDYDGLRNGTVTLNAPTALSGLSFLTASGNGATSISVTVTHSGGGTETFTISSKDWGDSSSVAYTPGGRVYPLILYNRGTTFYLHYADITLSDTVNPVTSIAFTYVSTGRAVIYAVAGQAPAGSTYTPVAVAGFNADGIIEKEATPLAPLYTATTVSMDGGTNNTGNTWYEQGFYSAFPSTGLPAAGSTMTSASLADHHYQMPPSYTTNNAVYVDSAHPTANLTIAAPQTLSALSFLSSCANGWVSNSCVMQYQDGTTETNYFVSQDWFNNSPVAFNANGRVNLDTRRLDSVNAGNPRLYEAQFALGNTSSAVTNIVLNYLNSSGGTSSRMVVFAVSGTAGAVPPIIAVGTPASVSTYETSNVVLTAQITGGTAPITTTWYFSGNSGGTWSTVSDGGSITGATTSSLTNSSIALANAGLYKLVAQNVAGSVTSSVATVTVRSGLPDVLTKGDPIVAYQPNGGSSPTAEDVTHAIDHDLGKYLNGASGTTPFQGPIGFVVTPSMGKTTVSVLRLYTANDSAGRDPADYTLEGSNDGGANWVTISSGPLALPDARNAGSGAINPLTQNLQEVRFANSVGYTSYRVSFANIKDDAGTSMLQIGEVELLGVGTPVPPTITVEPVASDKVFVGASPTFSVEAYGYPTNLSYQWYLNGTTVIPGATSASYTVPNVQLSDSGKSFSCVITNSAGSTNTTSATLTVVARPTQAYPVAVLADSPLGFWRLDETPDNNAGNNGVAANDYVGGHSGIYSNTVLAAAGYNPLLDGNFAASFGAPTYASDSFVGGIPDLNFATPSNHSAAFTLEAWVKGPAQTADAGIISKGTGAGGEQFVLDTGAQGDSHYYRFGIRSASGGWHSAEATNGPDGNWHHLVGVCDEANSNLVLYVDGIQKSTGVGLVMPWNGLLSSTHPVSIGSRQSGSGAYDNQFNGTIDEVAIYGYALSPSKVLAHYYAANPGAQMLVQPTNITAVPEGTSATFYSLAYGPGTITYQWYQSSDYGLTYAPLSGQTSSNLTLVNISAQNLQYYYEVVAANAYGSVTSAPVVVSQVISGPPQLQVDLPYQGIMAYAGRTINLAVTVGGTAPFTYTWQSNGVTIADGGRFSGTHSNVLTIANVQLSDAATYQVFVSNTQGGPVPSSPCALYVETAADFNTNGIGWTLNGGANLYNDVLTLTDGGTSEARSAFYNYPQFIEAFYAEFVYQDVNPPNPQADGLAFVLHNDPLGPFALGGGGGALALDSITRSAALTLNLWNGAGMSFGLDGANGSPYHSTAPVDISTGDPIKVSMLYSSGNALVTLTDLSFGVSFTTNIVVNMPAVVGADTAYVGFTAATGGYASTQTVSNFVFVSYPTLSAQAVDRNTVALSWPGSIAGYKLQVRSSLNAGSWADVTAPVNMVADRNQVLVPTTGAGFYRLSR